MSAGSLIRRVAVREYGPLAAIVLAWLAIGITTGHADAVRLFAALTFVRAARSLTAPGTLVPLRKRLRQGQHQAQATRVALAVELLALPFAAAVLAGILAFLWSAGQAQMAVLCLFFAPALPAQMPDPVRRPPRVRARLSAGTGRRRTGPDRRRRLAGRRHRGIRLAVRGARLAGLPAVLRAGAGDQAPRRASPIGPLHWREIAEYSHARARKLAAYRFSKVFLHALLGPFGTIAARTGRGLRMDRKADRFVPAHPAVLALLAIAAAAACATLVLLVPQPALLVVAATLLRVTAAAGNILIWSALSNAASDDAEQADDDDDEM